MSDSSLIPERQLVFSPALAQTLGLEEAVLLQHLNELFQHRQAEERRGYLWLEVQRDWLLATLPFWSAVDLHRISRSLADKGVILVDSPPLHDADVLLFAINESRSDARAASRSQTRPAAPQPTRAPRQGGAGLMAENWTPSEDLLQLLSLNHGITRQFAIEQLEDFIYYWCERGEVSHAWENKFRQHVLSRWRNSQQSQAERFAITDDVLSDNWYPSADALEILDRNGVARDFVDDAIPEFVLYWRERGMVNGAWNTKFIEHIRRQWAKFSASFGYDDTPKTIPVNWQPSNDCFEILALAEIDENYARSKIPEFVMYWRDTQQVKSSWNTVFLQFIKQDWARQLKQNESADLGYAENQSLVGSSQQRVKERFQRIADRSWAA